MWVVRNASSGAETMTLAASSFTLKVRKMDTIREYPSNAIAEK